MSLTAYPTLRLKLTMPQALKLQFLPAIPGSNASAAADRAEQAAQDAQAAADAAVAATANKVDRTGDVMTGFLTLNADPTANLQAATKQYVDSHSAGIPDGDKGDITTSSGGTVWTIDADAVTYAKMQNVSVSARFLGRFSGGAGDIEEGTGTQATALLDVFTSTLKGLAPLSGGGTTNFLRADGTWAAPAGGGGGAPVGAEYITASADATLTNERVLTNTASITWDFTTPGQAKASTAAGGGNVSNSGTPTVGQYAKWVTATTIQGVAVGTVLTDIGAQPLDADLTAIAALAGTNVIYYRSAANTWTAVTIGANLTFTGGTLAATGGGGGVSISGTPVAGQVAEWTNATTIRGVNSVPHYTASATAPVAPIAGDQWYDLNSGMLSIYVNDGNSSQWVQIGGGSLGTPSLGVVLRVITTSQSYVPTPGTQFVVVECIGGGGGGGGAGATTSFTGGAGGGAGGRSLARLTAAQIGGSKPVTIGIGGAAGAAAFAPSGNGGNGGDTSLDALCVAKGGTGGQGAVTANAGGNGGAGGIAGTGDVTGTGAPGGSAVGALVQTTGAYTSLGGSSAWGGGAVAPNQTVGAAAGGYGGGGSGGTTFSAAVGGGNGSPGIVIITEYVVTLVTVVGSPTTVGGPPQGRLTLVTQTPVMTATATGIGSVFYTPYQGDKIPLYDGVNWLMTPFTELTCLTTDTTKNPAAIGASKVNDWFVWSDAGTLRLSHGPDWTNDTTRSAGTALTKLNGILTNAVAITNGPGVNRGTYVGTTRSNASSQLDWILGGVDTAASLFVWNTYNRVPVASIISASTSSWSYATGVVRQPNNAAFYRINIICGLNEDMVAIVYQAKAQTSVANGTAITGIGLNSTNGFATSSTVNQLAVYAAGTAMTVPAAPAIWLGYPGIGYNFWCALETGDNTNASTYFGESYSALYAQSLRM